MSTPTKIEIMNFIIKHPGATARQISLDLHLTPADVHYHLSKMLEQGQIQTTPPPKILPGVGRPAKGYVLSNQTPFNNTHILLKAVLEVCPQVLRPSQLPILAAALTVNFTRPARSSIRALADEIVRFFSSMNYQPHWEASRSGPRIIFDHCPYAFLTSQLPQLCQLDAEMLTQLFGSEVSILQTCCSTTQPKNRCIFQVHP